ncbi:uncharacterized protein [Lolium perenne]|uniref:uncharacterized protein isoform X2 n=1 Tax=Lolium perenne TaxID=4522 RepID=UPI0021F5CAFF|nr:uncharacterized protein LOC127300737 isoform X2 [Lolium perenne]
MPISPSLRRSPAKEIAHKRRRSFGSTLPAKSKDDGLLLFNDLKKSERENFLLEQPDDLGESLSKLNYFPNFNLGFKIAGRVESRDLLNVDGDKNDYDWLLTPPETPLFRSLDDEENHCIDLAPRGRSQTKPLSISRSSTKENTQRSRRSSASPNRLSPSPRSNCNAALTRTRSSNSSSRSSPPLALQPSITLRRSSTPPAAKTLTPPRRSPCPASRRVITSSGPTLNGTRGGSPVIDNRRSSLPKLHVWQSNDLGFSFDAPPNLRTSLPDRPVSRSRGGSPSSFSGLDMGSRGSRRSISPTLSRIASSSGSNERDRFGSYIKASATSSVDDDLDCVQSVPVGYDGSPAVKKSLSVMKTKTLASAKKLSKSFSSNSAPKRNFDSAVWLMDHRKAPQDMFRPLLSSVPTTTFVAGKGSNVHLPVLSRNSSITTSSNASFDHRATFGSFVEDGKERHNLASECEATASSGIHDIFMFDKFDELNEASCCQQRSLSPTRSGPEVSSSIEDYVKGSTCDCDMESSQIANQSSSDVASSSESGHGKMASCARCGKLFNVMDVDGCHYCEECTLKFGVFSANPEIHTTEETHHQHHKLCIPSEACLAVPGCVEDCSEASLDHRPVINEPPSDCSSRCPTQLTVDTTEEVLLRQRMKDLPENKRLHTIVDSSVGNSNDTSSNGVNIGGCQLAISTYVAYDHFRDQNDNLNHGMPQGLSELYCQGNEVVSDIRTTDSHKSTWPPSNKVNYTEGTGISVILLQKSSSNTWPVLEGRPLVATSILCSEPYYTRDNDNLISHINRCDSSSVTSSVDVGSSRQYEVHFEHLKSSKHGDCDKSQIGSTVSHQSIASVSDMSISDSSVSFCPLNDACYPIDNSENNASRIMISAEEYGSCKDALSSAIECWSVAQAIVNDDSETARDVVIQNQSADRMAHNDDICTSMSLDADGNCIKISEENVAITNYAADTPEHPHPWGENCCYRHQMQSEVVLVSDEANRLDDYFVSTISEEDVQVSATEAKIANLPNDVPLFTTLHIRLQQLHWRRSRDLDCLLPLDQQSWE